MPTRIGVPAIYEQVGLGAGHQFRMPASGWSLATSGPGPWYDVTHPTFGAKGDGVHDDGLAIQAACDACRIAGGGTVFVPPGTYLARKRAHPNFGGHFALFWVGSNTTLAGAGIGNTTFKLANNEPLAHNDDNGAGLVMNFNASTFTDTEITLRDFTLDGNQANQTVAYNNGIHLSRVSRCHLERVRVQDIFGAAAGGVDETFFVEIARSSDVTHVDCECIATGAAAGNTSTGFSADQSTNVKWIGCYAINMGKSNGFTHHTCDHLKYLGCDSYLNFNLGFNSEDSRRILYAGCQAGGLAGVSANSQQGAYTANQNLGNTSNGFRCSGSTDVSYASCVSDHNGANGWSFTQDVPNSLSVRRVALVGCIASNNTGNGVSIDSDSSKGNVLMDPTCWCFGNAAQILYDGTNTASMRANVATITFAPSPATFNNPFPFDIFVTVAGGGGVSGVSINGVGTLVAGGSYIIPATGSITVTYPGASPTMTMWGL